MQPPERASLWELTIASGSHNRFVSDMVSGVQLDQLARARGGSSDFEGRSVLICCDRQVPAVMALLALDGVARRILLCPPDLSPEHLPAVIAEADVDMIVSDGSSPLADLPHGLPVVSSDTLTPQIGQGHSTEWLLFTSGTTRRPKIVRHTLTSLIGPLEDGPAITSPAVWSSFYDIRRYGGLTILFRALLGGSSMVLSHAVEPVPAFLVRAGQLNVTHISGTPSHWRRALMSPTVGAFSPHYVRLSGEVADQAILNNLQTAFPNADIAHAFASTEAGFAFDVRDRLAGFPAMLVDQVGGKAELRVRDGSLLIRSPRTALGYVGETEPLLDAEGFVDTGDMLELRGDRYYFIGRREGIINVGGRKVHPEEVESIINQHPAVQMARVRGRPSSLIGAIVVADFVVRPAYRGSTIAIRDEILTACRRALSPHKVPTTLQEVSTLDIAGSGKMVRRDA